MRGRKLIGEGMKAHVIYHGNCYDGFGAAWAAWKHFGDNATYSPALYGQAPKVPDEVTQLYLLDFSYPEKIMVELTEKYDVTILDHHKTAIEDLNDLFEIEPRRVEGCLDDTHSGAILAWNWFHPDLPPPRFLDYIEDRDLWKYELEGSREFSAALRSYDMDFQLWDNLERLVLPLIQDGKAILRAQDKQVEIMAKQAVVRDIAGYRVPVVNTTVYFSEVGSLLLEWYHDAPFAAYYFDRADGIRQWGLRSRETFDCSVVAKEFGGGGHPQASGFTTKVPEVIDIRRDKRGRRVT